MVISLTTTRHTSLRLLRRTRAASSASPIAPTGRRRSLSRDYLPMSYSAMTRKDDPVKLYRREARKRRPVIAKREKAVMKEAKSAYDEANKPYRPGRPRGIKVGNRAKDF